MKKIIAKKTYNTDTAALVAHVTFGEFGDAAGYEEKLYQTKKGDFFIYGIGGIESPYTEETIKAVEDALAAVGSAGSLVFLVNGSTSAILSHRRLALAVCILLQTI